MEWKQIDKNTWENISAKFDFIITKESKNYILDVFNTKVKNNNQAYIDSIEFKNLKAAKLDAKQWI